MLAADDIQIPRLFEPIVIAGPGFDVELPPEMNLDAMSAPDRKALMEALAEVQRRAKQSKIDSFYPDTGPLRRELYPRHLEFFWAGSKWRERCFMAGNRIGKALQHGTRVATPSGWRAIEDMRIGDAVIAGDGSITTVVGVYPQGEVDLFNVSMDGMHDVATCAEHLWLYQHPRARFATRMSHGKTEANPFHGQWTVGNTAALARLGKTAKGRAVVPMTKPWALAPMQPLPLDPYLLGVLLGDGGLSRDSVKLTTADPEIAAAFGECAVKYGQLYEWGINGLMPTIRALGLQGKTSGNKFVPHQYLTADAASRLAMLQGLMDTDGSIHGAGGAMEFSTTSDQLADDFCWLAASLGFKTRRERRHTSAQNGNGAPSWRIHLRTGTTCPFRLQRKVARWKPLRETPHWLVHGVKPAGRGEATCIEVAHASHTFVIEHGIVTHNTEGSGGYETALHLTGQYPHWWPGRRFDRPVNFWAAGKTNETTRDIIQAKLFGPISWHSGDKGVAGTGLVRGNCLGRITWKAGVADLIDTIAVKHVSGGWSRLGLKSYQQGRGSFEGTEQDGIWLDEEPPLDIYGECLIRTATTNGLVFITFTPLEGVTGTVLHFLPGGAGEVLNA